MARDDERLRTMRLPRELALNDGTTLRLIDWVGHIEHVAVPWGGGVGGDHIPTTYLRRGEEALITSILIVPHGSGPVPASPDLGTIIFGYNDRKQFSAPVVALMNRYHGLTTSVAMLNRARLVLDPSVGLADLVLDGAFVAALPHPIHVREGLSYGIDHVAPKAPAADDRLLVASDILREKGMQVDAAEVQALVAPPSITVELQMLFMPGSDRRVGLRW